MKGLVGLSTYEWITYRRLSRVEIVSSPGFEPATYISRSRHANHSATASAGLIWWHRGKRVVMTSWLTDGRNIQRSIWKRVAAILIDSCWWIERRREEWYRRKRSGIARRRVASRDRSYRSPIKLDGHFVVRITTGWVAGRRKTAALGRLSSRSLQWFYYILSYCCVHTRLFISVINYYS